MGWADHVAAIDSAVQRHMGDALEYRTGYGEVFALVGVFDAAYVRVDGGGEAGVSTVGPVLFARVIDLPADYADDRDANVIVSGVEYRVHEVQPDGQGGVLLLLHRVS